MIVSCTKCAVKLKVDESKVKPGGSKLKCPKCQNIFMIFRPEEQADRQPAMPGAGPQYPPPPQAPAPPPPVQAPPVPPAPVAPPAPAGPKWELDRRKVVVAHNGDATLQLMVGMLNQSGFQAIGVKDGVEAMLKLEQNKPAVAVLDVALPSIFGFEICDRIKNNPSSSEMKILLLASIYDKTKYKRAPTSLYGADDYIEKHHIEDVLVQKVNRLLSPAAAAQPQVREESLVPPPPPEVAAVREQHAQEMRREEIPQIQEPSGVDPKQAEAARRFARIILSDIALYNQPAVEDGIRNGNFEQALSEELKEGRELYNSRVPAEVRASMDYFAEEMTNFVEKKKRIMEMGS